MKKLKLNINDLKVESFDTQSKDSLPKGTVLGNVVTRNDDPTCLYGTCAVQYPWGLGCPSGAHPNCEPETYACSEPPYCGTIWPDCT